MKKTQKYRTEVTKKQLISLIKEGELVIPYSENIDIVLSIEYKNLEDIHRYGEELKELSKELKKVAMELRNEGRERTK